MIVVVEPSRDLGLALRAADGDADALGAVYDRYAPQVKRFLVGLRMPIPRQDLEDAVQETFLRLLRGLSGFDPKRPLEPYVLAIARNVAIDLCRRTRPEPREVDPLGPADRAADEQAWARERSALIAAALGALQPEARTILTLRHVNHLKMKDLREVLDCSAPTARARLREAAQLFGLELRRRGLTPEEVCS